MIYIIYFYLIWSSVAHFIIVNAGKSSSIFSNIDEIVVLLLLFHIFWLFLKEKRNVIPKTNLNKPFFYILLIAVISAIVNKSLILNGVLFLFSIFKPVIIFYWILIFEKEERIAKFGVKLLTVLIIIQIPFFIFGLFAKGTEYFGDPAQGAVITGDAHQVGIYTWLGIFSAFGYYLVKKERKYLLFLIITFILFVITSTKVLMFLLPVILVYLLRKQLNLGYKRISQIIVVGGIAGLFLFRFVETYWANAWEASYDDFDSVDYVTGSEKILGYNSVLFELPDDIEFPWILGAGPGMYGSSTAMNSRPPLAEKYIMYYNDLIPEGKEGTFTYRSSSIIGILGEIGLIPLILIFVIYFRIIKKASEYSELFTESNNKVISFITSAAGLMLLLYAILQNIWEGNWFILNLFWILTACIYMKLKENNKITLENE